MVPYLTPMTKAPCTAITHRASCSTPFWSRRSEGCDCIFAKQTQPNQGVTMPCPGGNGTLPGARWLAAAGITHPPSSSGSGTPALDSNSPPLPGSLLPRSPIGTCGDHPIPGCPDGFGRLELGPHGQMPRPRRQGISAPTP